MNRLRNPRLTLMERNIAFMDSTEVDELRVLERLPVGSKERGFKFQQFQDASVNRQELKKLCMEEQLKLDIKQYDIYGQKMEAEFNNKNWVDEHRKKIIGDRQRRDFAPEPMLFLKKQNLNNGEGSGGMKYNKGMDFDLNKELNQKRKGYDPKQGFIVYWDYIIGIVNDMGLKDFISTHNILFIISVVCEGETLVEPFVIDPKPIETQGKNKIKSTLIDQIDLQNILVNPETLLIWEIQLVSESEEETKLLGWTQIDLFEISNDLKRGFWKCPLYMPPVDLNITKEKIQNLKVNYGPWVYLRIAFPWKDQFTIVESFDHQVTAGQYFIPDIHLRAAHYKPVIEIDYQQNVKYIENKNSPVFQKINKRDSRIIRNPREKFNRIESSESTPSDDNRLAPKTKPRGIKIVIHRIKKHVAGSHNKIGLAILEEKNKIYDDNGKNCVRNTTVHNPLFNDASRSEQSEYMENKAQGSDIVFNEEFIFLRNFPVMYSLNQKEIYIIFQMMEKPQPKNVLDKDKISYDKARIDNYGGMEYKLNGWTHFKVLNNDGVIKNGKFTSKLFRPPYKLPPIDPKKVQISNAEIEFSILEYQYDQTDRDKQLRDKKKKYTKKKKAKEKTEISEGDKDVNLDNRSYIPNSKPQYKDKQFVKGYGVDFYVDAARFLPDNVTVTKLILRFINNKFQDQFETPVFTLLPKFNSPSYSPVFDFRQELRGDYFDSTMMVFITIVTRDKSCNENRIVGYAALNLFINRFTKMQPENNNDPDMVLYDGCYEIPIIAEEPLRTKPFNMEKLMRYDQIPAASLLVRINMAPLSDDWKRVLTIKDFPKSEWVSRKLWIPRPLYSTGIYNNGMKLLKPNEIDLYAFRQARPDNNVKESALLLIHAENINKNMNKKEIFEWCDVNIDIDQTSKLIDPMFFAKYQSQSGFKFILDGVNNIGKDTPVIGFYSLNPPGKYYSKEKNSEDLILNSLINWDSTVGQTIFFDKWYYFRNVDFHVGMHIPVEIKSLKKKDNGVEISDFAWTVVPVFHPREYTLNGHYQIPLFSGEVNKKMLEEIVNMNKEVWEIVEQYLKDGKIKYKGKSSIFVRLLDCQKEGQLDDKLDIDTLNYRYLPKKKKQLKEFAFNQQIKLLNENKKKIEKFIPDNIHTLDFNKRIVDTALEKYDIKNFNFDFN